MTQQAVTLSLDCTFWEGMKESMRCERTSWEIQTDEFYIFFDHPMDEPQIVEEDAAIEKGAEEFDDPIYVDSIMRELQSSPSTEDDGHETGGCIQRRFGH